jgi:hypothetical protein
MEAQTRKEQQFFVLAERFRNAPTPKKRGGWEMNSHAWYLAADAQD